MSKKSNLTFLLFILPLQVYASRHSNCPIIQWMSPTLLSLYYLPTNTYDKPYFYAKAYTEPQFVTASFAQLSSSGNNLVYQPNTKPSLYQVPKNSTQLIILKSKEKLSEFDDDSIIEPEIRNSQKPSAASTLTTERNANNLPQPLPHETTAITVARTIEICDLSVENGY